MLGPLLFNIFLNDLLLINLRSIVCNFADDNTLLLLRRKYWKRLESELKIVLKWFRNNQMMANLAKFQCMLLGKHKSEEFQLESAKSVNLLGITIDYNLTFDTHVSNIYKTASAKLKSLSRIRNALEEKLARLLCNSFILSQFNYCSIIWMFYSKTRYKKANKFKKEVYEYLAMSLRCPWKNY